MKLGRQKWVIVVFAAVFALSLVLGVGLRLQRFRAVRASSEVTEPEPAASSPETVYTDPDAPSYTDRAPETKPVAEYSAPEPTASETAEPQPAETVNEDNEPAAEESDLGDGIITLCIGGDTSVNGEFADFARTKSPDYPWEDVAWLLKSADIAAVNLETCVSDRGTSEKKEGYGFETPPEMLEGFGNAGIDIVNLANNHTRDYGLEALTDTFANLGEYGIKYFGAGRDSDEAGDLTVIEREGIKVGFTGANRVYLPPDCAAGEDRPGINMIGGAESDTAAKFVERIAEFDSQCDVLVVFLHAGEEGTFEVTDYQKKMCRKFIDAGADIVVGGHPHTLQPVEFYNGKPIIYSVGNFIFWHRDDDKDGLSAVFEITLDRNGFRELKLHPLFIKNYKVNYLYDGSGSYPTRYRQIIDLMNENCARYGTAFDGGGVMYTLN